MEITQHRAAPTWWSNLVNGLLLVVLAGLALFTSGTAYQGLSTHFTIVILLNGVLGGVFAWAGRHQWPGWGWTLAAGLAGGFFALVLLLSPHLFGSPAVTWLALGLGACGLAGVVLALQLRVHVA